MLAQSGALNFMNPSLAIAGAAAMSIPIAIHLLTLWRRQRQSWGAMRFVLEAYRSQRTRLRLERWLLLLVRCLILLILGLSLSGPMLAGGGGLGVLSDQGRWVCLVIDDSLSTQALDIAETTRFEALKRRGVSVLDQLGPGDQVAIWRSGRPGTEVKLPVGSDLSAAREAIESLRPRSGRSDLLDTLGMVGEEIERRSWPRDRVFVVILSDFAAATLPLDRAVPERVLELGRQTHWVVSRPWHEVTNMQVCQVTPQRRTIVLSKRPLGDVIPVDVHLKRFVGKERSLEPTSVELSVRRLGATEGLATTRRDVRWSQGQSEMRVQVEVPLTAGDLSHENLGPDGLELRVRIEPGEVGGGRDAIAGDNSWSAVIRVRDHMSVGILDTLSDDIGSAGRGLSSREWLRLGLLPHSGVDRFVDVDPGEGMGELRVEQIDASEIGPGALSEMDVVFLLRPDLVTKSGWGHLKQRVDRGGTLWVFVPGADVPQLWGEGFTDSFGVPWRLEIESQVRETGGRRGWSLSTDTGTPDVLRLLSADWAALLGPVRVYQRVSFEVDGPEETVWVRTDDNEPLMASESVGDGRVLLMGVAIDPDWTNLPTKPLFIPLLHETLRGVLGESGYGQALDGLVCGDRPVLGVQWKGASGLVNITRSGGEGDHDGDDVIELRPLNDAMGDALQPVSEIRDPGVYVASASEVGGALAVNHDPLGGDTNGMDPVRLGKWLDAVGRWDWLDPIEPGASLRVDSPRVHLGWPLLWVVLGLVMIEMGLARWFSHARGPAVDERSGRAGVTPLSYVSGRYRGVG